MFKSLFGSGEQQEPPNLLERLKLGIQKTRAGLVEAFTGKKEIDTDLLDELEYALITADVGVRTATEILDRARQRAERHMIADIDELKPLIRQPMLGTLEPAAR